MNMLIIISIMNRIIIIISIVIIIITIIIIIIIIIIIYLSLCVYIYIYICIHTYICVYVCIYIYIERERERYFNITHYLVRFPVPALMGNIFFPPGLHNQCRSDSGNSNEYRKRLHLVSTIPPFAECGCVARSPLQEGGRVPLVEILLPRIARQGTICQQLIILEARTTRIEICELDEDFQPYRPPFREYYVSGSSGSS